MNCPNCNAVIDDDSVFCANCGEPLKPVETKAQSGDKSNDLEGTEAEAVKETVTDPQASGSQAPDKPAPDSTAPDKQAPDTPVPAFKSADSKTDVDSFGQNTLKDKAKLIGLIVGTALIAVGIYRISNAGTTISSTSFGGDFYTYTYQGIVAISRILASIEVTLGWVIVAIGAAIDVISLR